MNNRIKVPVGISNRHIHLCQEDLNILFGIGYKLNNMRSLNQIGEFASEEVVKIVGVNNNIISNIRIVGPVRGYTQIEILEKDQVELGIKAPIRMSGDLKDTPGVTIIGPKGIVNKDKGVIIANRHIHCTLKQAKEYNWKENQELTAILNNGIEEIVINDIKVKINELAYLEIHIDKEEANNKNIKNGEIVIII